MSASGRFVSGPSVSDILADFMNPLMEEAGFSRRKNRYQIKGENGAFVGVQVRPWGMSNESASFNVDWSVIPPVLAGYLGREKRLSWPALYNGLFVERVEAPESVRALPTAKGLWECRFAEYDRFGAVYTGALRSSVIPSWLACLDPPYLRSTDIGSDNAFPFGYVPWREIVLTVDDGDPDRLEELFREAATRKQPEPDFLPWLRARFETRF